MKQQIHNSTLTIWRWVSRHRKLVIVVAVLAACLPVLLVMFAQRVMNANSKYVLDENSDQHAKVGIVLGAGVNSEGKPYKELKARLDVAADALQQGTVERLIVSGDNRFKNYNEPDAMRDYLVKERHIPAKYIQPDYAGRSTYESCERASRIFGLHKTIIFSVESHLPRAIFLCRHFGIEAYGMASHVEAGNASRRELMAGVKALYNTYLRGESTVLGDPIPIQ